MDTKQRLIIFDLDGTLVDSARVVAEVVNAEVRARNRTPFPDEQYQIWMGQGLRALVQQAYRDAHIDVPFETWYDTIQRTYAEVSPTMTEAYEGVLQMIRSCKKLARLAVWSNKIERITCKMVDALFPRLFDAVYGLTDQYPPKPHPARLHLLMKQFNVAPERCLLVGDTEIDYATAKNGNIKFYAVSWGYRPLSALLKLGATHYIRTPAELVAKI